MAGRVRSGEEVLSNGALGVVVKKSVVGMRVGAGVGAGVERGV